MLKYRNGVVKTNPNDKTVPKWLEYFVIYDIFFVSALQHCSSGVKCLLRGLGLVRLNSKSWLKREPKACLEMCEIYDEAL